MVACWNSAPNPFSLRQIPFDFTPRPARLRFLCKILRFRKLWKQNTYFFGFPATKSNYFVPDLYFPKGFLLPGDWLLPDRCRNQEKSWWGSSHDPCSQGTQNLWKSGFNASLSSGIRFWFFFRIAFGWSVTLRFHRNRLFFFNAKNGIPSKSIAAFFVCLLRNIYGAYFGKRKLERIPFRGLPFQGPLSL